MPSEWNIRQCRVLSNLSGEEFFLPSTASNNMTTCVCVLSLLAEVSHDETNWNDKRETSAGFRRVVWWSRRPNFWSKLIGFQNRFHLKCNARALLDCTLTIIQPTVDYDFHEICEFRNFSFIKSSVSKLGDKRIKKWRLYKEKSYLVSLKDAIRLRVSRRATANLSFLLY